MIVKVALALSLLATSLMAAPKPAAPALSASERAIARAVDVQNAAGLALLERVVNINSGTHNLEGVREVGGIFRAELDALGFNTSWVAQDDLQRGGHLVADHPGP